MTVLVHTPYGLSHKESSLIYLFANYLKTTGLDLTQIACNGVFSLCDKDEEVGWRRTIDFCMNCTHNQKSLAGWSAMRKTDLSLFLSPDEITLTRRVINEMPLSKLTSMSFAGNSIYEMCLESFRLRTGSANPDFNNKKQEQLIRRYMLSTVRMCIAAKRLLSINQPVMSLLASGQDFITRSYLEQGIRLGSKIVVFKMDLHERCIKIHDTLNSKAFSCPLLVNDVTTMRADVSTWPKEMLSMMHQIADYLDISDSQISLPLAQ